MSNFQESGINFKFQSPKWNVVKYDEHLAHKKVSNALQPTKAVDFLGIHDNRQLFLVEVKNYRGHTHDAETQEVLQAKGEELMRRIAVKVRDTIATVTNSARFSTNDEDFFTRIRLKISLLSCRIRKSCSCNLPANFSDLCCRSFISPSFSLLWIPQK